MTNLINKITKLSTFLILAGSLNSCDYTKTEQSEILYEKGKVITTLYNQKHSDSEIGAGMTTGGDLVVTSNSIDIPEKWGVVFKCEHGNKFPIMGKGEEYKKLWEELEEGDSVKISYKENYKIIYDYKTDKPKSKELIDYDFINAKKIGREK